MLTPSLVHWFLSCTVGSMYCLIENVNGRGGKGYFYMLIFMFLYRYGQICVMFSGELVNGIIVAEDSAKIVSPGIRDGSYMYVQIDTEVGGQL